MVALESVSLASSVPRVAYADPDKLECLLGSGDCQPLGSPLLPYAPPWAHTPCVELSAPWEAPPEMGFPVVCDSDPQRTPFPHPLPKSPSRPLPHGL